MYQYIKLFRVWQWIKNGFLFLPIFLAQKIFAFEALFPTILGAIAFSFIASSIYVINDFFDRVEDAKHPKKKNRPIASGSIKPFNAMVAALILFVFAAIICLFLPLNFSYTLLAYLILNMAYSAKLKHIPIIDVFVLSIGYIARVFAGGFTAQVEPSEWLVLMTLLLALFITFAKRRDDVVLFVEQGTKARKVIDGYNISFLNTAMSIMGAIIIVAYTMYTMSPGAYEQFHSKNLYLTVIFVIMGVLRYLQIAMVEKNAGAPTELLLKDLFLQLVILAWLGSLYYFIYW